MIKNVALSLIFYGDYCIIDLTMIKRFLCFVCTIALVIPFSLFFGCNQAKYVYDFYAFNNTPVVISVSGKELSASATDKISGLLTRLDGTYSATDPNSFVYKLNAAESGKTFSLSAEEKFLLDKCFNYSELTSNKFNPSVYPFVKLWHFSTLINNDDFVPPTQEEIDKISSEASVLMENFIISGEGDGYTITKLNFLSMIDLGGILKGYAAEEIYDILVDEGVSGGYISIGGSSIKLMDVPSLGIRHPRNTEELIITVNTDGKTCAVSTSGDYERFYTYDGKRYSHIIDGNTGTPYDTGIVSATVISNDGTFCDAMSTSLCLSSFDEQCEQDNDLISEAKKIISNGGEGTAVFAVYCKGEVKRIITNKKQGEDFTLLDSSYVVVNF